MNQANLILPEYANPTNSLSITAKNLGKRFNREWIFRRFSYTFTSGKTYALTGPNGSGKSTLLQVLSGHVPSSEGSIIYQKGSESIAEENIFKSLAIAAPYMDVIDEFTLREQLNFHFKLRKIRNELSIDELIDRMYLNDSQNKQIYNFSSGMRQRVKLALAFYTEADLVLLDEPGTNLDEKAFNWYRSELMLLPEQTVVIIASNNTAEYSDDTIRIHIPDFK